VSLTALGTASHHTRRRRIKASSTSAPFLAAYAAALCLTTPSFAKTPGEIHCYNGICHRVKSVDEMDRLVGMTTEDDTSFYDSADKDRMNAGTITSSGEEFDADSDTHAASAYYPDGTELLVWNPKNRRAAHIRVNDFGPFYLMRTIDVTRGVAEKLDFVKSGTAKLKITVIWAPGRDDARYRRLRQYAAVEGYLGQIDADQLTALKSRLISTAGVRNGQHPGTAVAALELETPRYSLQTLPAFVAAGADNSAARRIAAIMNAPRFTLVATPAKVTVAASAGISASLVAADAPAVDAADLPALAVVARDLPEPPVTVSMVETPQTPAGAGSTAHTQAGPGEMAAAAPVTLAAHTAPQARPAEVIAARLWPANPLAWQELLAALGLLTSGAIALRFRAAPARTTVRSAAHVPAHLTANAAHPSIAQMGSVAAPIVLPHLPEAQAAPSVDALRETAIACMERYAYVEAEAAYRALYAARRQTLGEGDPMTASAERQLADCLREQGRYAAAEPHYLSALAAMTAAAGEMHPAIADILDEYATSVLRQGYGSRAEILARQALAVRRATAGRGREFALTLSIVAETLRAQGQLVAAEIEHRDAITVLIAVCGPESLEVASGQLNLGALLGELGRFAAAEELLNQATRTLTAACGNGHPASALCHARLGDLYRRAGAHEQALAMHRHAFSIRDGVFGARHPDTIESLLTLSQIAADHTRSDDARTMLDRALDALIGAERTHFGPQSRLRSLLVALSQHFETTQPRAVAAE